MGGSRRQRSDVAGIIDQHADRCRPGEHREPRELGVADDLVGHQNVADAGSDERLGFADFLTTDADGAARDLAFGDLGTLVALGVRPQTETLATAIDRFRHHAQVALEKVEVDDQRRCVDGGENLAHACRHARRAGIVHAH